VAGDKGPVKYDGSSAEVTWDGRVCIHVGECGHAQGDLFVGGRDPWCRPDAVSADEALEVVQRCPTGALNLVRKDGGKAEEAATSNVVLVSNNGPLYARGELQIDGAPADLPGLRFRAALCRCGQSQNKPFCDNQHEETGFRDHGSVGEAGDGIATEGGPLVVKRAKNGPLLVAGNFSIVAASGRRAWQGTKAALCRCGHSQNKPFCDGAHKTAGFQAE